MELHSGTEMSVDDIIFEPLGKTQSGPSVSVSERAAGIIRYPGAVLAEVQYRSSRRVYTDLANEIHDFAVTDMPSLTDIRKEAPRVHGAIDLTGLVGRFHDGNEELWVSRPKHMQPGRHRFTGRFGYAKVCKMPVNMSNLGYITWYWIDTDDGQLPAVDLGLLVYHPSHKWWRVFTNKSDAQEYYNS
jgi:hypothetical protein